MHFRPRTQPILAHKLGRDMIEMRLSKVYQKMSVAFIDSLLWES